MANTNSTLPSTEQSRAGAIACLEALQAIEIIADSSMHRSKNDKAGMSMEEWWRIQDAAVAEMFQLSIAEKPHDFIAGFVAAFAEYAMCVNCSGVPNLHRWKPESTMTKEEEAAYRAQFASDVAAMQR